MFDTFDKDEGLLSQPIERTVADLDTRLQADLSQIQRDLLSKFEANYLVNAAGTVEDIRKLNDELTSQENQKPSQEDLTKRVQITIDRIERANSLYQRIDTLKEVVEAEYSDNMNRFDTDAISHLQRSVIRAHIVKARGQIESRVTNAVFDTLVDQFIRTNSLRLISDPSTSEIEIANALQNLPRVRYSFADKLKIAKQKLSEGTILTTTELKELSNLQENIKFLEESSKQIFITSSDSLTRNLIRINDEYNALVTHSEDLTKRIVTKFPQINQITSADVLIEVLQNKFITAEELASCSNISIKRIRSIDINMPVKNEKGEYFKGKYTDADGEERTVYTPIGIAYIFEQAKTNPVSRQSNQGRNPIPHGLTDSDIPTVTVFKDDLKEGLVSVIQTPKQNIVFVDVNEISDTVLASLNPEAKTPKAPELPAPTYFFHEFADLLGLPSLQGSSEDYMAEIGFVENLDFKRVGKRLKITEDGVKKLLNTYNIDTLYTRTGGKDPSGVDYETKASTIINYLYRLNSEDIYNPLPFHQAINLIIGINEGDAIDGILTGSNNQKRLSTGKALLNEQHSENKIAIQKAASLVRVGRTTFIKWLDATQKASAMEAILEIASQYNNALTKMRSSEVEDKNSIPIIEALYERLVQTANNLDTIQQSRQSLVSVEEYVETILNQSHLLFQTPDYTGLAALLGEDPENAEGVKNLFEEIIRSSETQIKVSDPRHVLRGKEGGLRLKRETMSKIMDNLRNTFYADSPTSKDKLIHAIHLLDITPTAFKQSGKPVVKEDSNITMQQDYDDKGQAEEDQAEEPTPTFVESLAIPSTDDSENDELDDDNSIEAQLLEMEINTYLSPNADLNQRMLSLDEIGKEVGEFAQFAQSELRRYIELLWDLGVKSGVKHDYNTVKNLSRDAGNMSLKPLFVEHKTTAQAILDIISNTSGVLSVSSLRSFIELLPENDSRQQKFELLLQLLPNREVQFSLEDNNLTDSIASSFQEILEVNRFYDELEAQTQPHKSIGTQDEVAEPYNIDEINQALKHITDDTPNSELPMSLGDIWIKSPEHLEEILSLDVMRGHLSDETILRWYDAVYANSLVENAENQGDSNEEADENNSTVDKNTVRINQLAKTHPEIDLSVITRSPRFYNRKFFNDSINRKLVNNMLESIENGDFRKNGNLHTEKRHLFIWGAAKSKTKALFKIEDDGNFTLLAIDRHDKIYNLVKNH